MVLPFYGQDVNSQYDPTGNANDADQEHLPVFLEDRRYLEEEVRIFEILVGGSPSHVVR